jgi:hypothetical protein
MLVCGLMSVAMAETIEAPAVARAPNFLTEFDITFWQTAPFIIFWSYVIDQQGSAIFALPGVPHWGIILGVSTVISTGNAYYHARKVVAASKR